MPRPNPDQPSARAEPSATNGTVPATGTNRSAGPRRFVEELAWLLFFLILSVAMTWPLIRSMGTAVSDQGDPFLNAWILNWDYWATFHQPSSLFQANIFYPARYTLAFSENLYGIALVLFPFFATGLSALTVYNIGILLGFAFSGYGAFVLCRMITASRFAGVIGGIFYAFVPFRFDHLPHLQHIWGGWLPILLAALLYFWKNPGWTRGIFVAAAFLMNGLTNIHWLLFGSVALGLSAILLRVGTSTVRTARQWLYLLAPLVCAALVLLPFLIPYQRVSRIYGLERDRAETVAGSATPRDWIISTPLNRSYGELAIVRSSSNERRLFPGLIALMLAGVVIFLARRDGSPAESLWPDVGERSLSPALIRWLDVLSVLSLVLTFIYTESDTHWKFSKFVVDPYPIPAMIFVGLVLTRLWFRYPEALGHERSLRDLLRRSRFPLEIWTAFLWILVGFLGSLGLNSFFHAFLFDFPQFRSIRIPARWAMITYVGLAVVAAAGAAVIRHRAGRRFSIAVTALLPLLLLFELRAAPIDWYYAEREPPPAYRWLASTDIHGAIAEMPFGLDPEYLYVLRATAHHKPLLNGVSGFYPPAHDRLVDLAGKTPLPLSLYDKLRESGASILVVHPDLLSETDRVPMRSWLLEGIRSGAAVFLRRFDDGVRGDWVFAIRPIKPEVLALRDERSDAAGRTPRENLEAFLSADAIAWTSGPIAETKSPANGENLEGALVIAGWAAADGGIEKVTVTLGNNRKHYEADLAPRQDLAALLPTFPSSDITSFRKVIQSRPRGIPRDTKVTVEIIDRRGRHLRQDPLNIHWKRVPLYREISREAWNPAALQTLIGRLGKTPVEADRILNGSL
ncbi:MAG: hypothetical protein ABI718_14910, partial [Acidobacteriota bacterium]